MIFKNKLHHGFIYDPPRALKTLEEIQSPPIPVLSAQFIQNYVSTTKSFEVPLPVEDIEPTNKPYKYDTNLIQLVQEWLEKNKDKLVISATQKQVIPIISFDKPIRYARTGQQRFTNPKAVRGFDEDGYAIKIKALEKVSTEEYTSYQWSVVQPGYAGTDEGRRFKKFVFNDFYKEKTQKNNELHSLTSFDYASDQSIYRFFCIGEIDGMELVEGTYKPVEVKSSIAKRDDAFYKTQDKYNKYVLPKHYAKCWVSHIPKLIVGKCEMEISEATGGRKTAKYYKILAITEANFPIDIKKLQEEQLETAIKVFHENISTFEKNVGYLNGYKNYSGRIDVKFSDKSRTGTDSK